ncbi:MAG: hypothetical protein JWR05_3698 [Mucilaginibacter sp.]|nr:hypothetical protein [Mucilaginibacter sp.]
MEKIREFLRQLVDAFRQVWQQWRADAQHRSSGRAGHGHRQLVARPARRGGGRRRRNPWPRCPGCHHRTPTLCPGADGQPCGLGPCCCPTHPKDTQR